MLHPHPCSCLDRTSTSCCLYAWLSKLIICYTGRDQEKIGTTALGRSKTLVLLLLYQMLESGGVIVRTDWKKLRALTTYCSLYVYLRGSSPINQLEGLGSELGWEDFFWITENTSSFSWEIHVYILKSLFLYILFPKICYIQQSDPELLSNTVLNRQWNLEFF